jgi:hypothetical protein
LKIVLDECYLNHKDFFEALESLGADFAFPKGPEKEYKNKKDRKFKVWEMR